MGMLQPAFPQRRKRNRWSRPIRRSGTTRSEVTTVVPASALGVGVLPLAGTTLLLFELLVPSPGLGMGMGTVVLGVVDGAVTGAVYTMRVARRSRSRASKPKRRPGVVVVTTVGAVGAAGAVAAGEGEGVVGGLLPAGGSAAQANAPKPHTAAMLNRYFFTVLPPETGPHPLTPDRPSDPADQVPTV
jgi:hypothetical protein